jgi:hypothetical protein
MQGLLQLLKLSTMVYAHIKDAAIMACTLNRAKRFYYDISRHQVEI